MISRKWVNALRELAQQMQETAKEADEEKAHAKADGLLCSALTLLAEEFELPPSASDAVHDLLDAFDSVGKWYA